MSMALLPYPGKCVWTPMVEKELHVPVDINDNLSDFRAVEVRKHDVVVGYETAKSMAFLV